MPLDPDRGLSFCLPFSLLLGLLLDLVYFLLPQSFLLELRLLHLAMSLETAKLKVEVGWNWEIVGSGGANLLLGPRRVDNSYHCTPGGEAIVSY